MKTAYRQRRTQAQVVRYSVPQGLLPGTPIPWLCLICNTEVVGPGAPDRHAIEVHGAGEVEVRWRGSR